jgi:hypothetical protein
VLQKTMPAVTLKAHYDGKSILLDEPFQIRANAELMVTVLQDHSEETDFQNLTISGLSRAYSESEPEYTLADLRA